MSNDIDYLESLLFSDDDNPADYSKSPDYVKALELYHNNDLEKADKLVDKELAAHPDSPYAHELKANVLVARGVWDDSVKHHIITAIDLFEKQENECDEYYRAVDNVLRCISVAPGLEARYAVMANDLARKMPTSRHLTTWGWFADSNNMHNKAIAAYKAALKAEKKDDLDTTNDNIYGSYLIPSLLRAGETAEAESTLAEAEKECPDGPDVRFARIYMLDREGRYEEAIDLCLETAFRIIANGDEEEEGEEGNLALCDQNAKWDRRLSDIANANYPLVMSKLEAFANRPDASPAVLQTAYNIATKHNAKDYLRIKRRIRAAGIEIEEEGAADFHIYWMAQAYAKALEASELWMADVQKFIPSEDRAIWIKRVRCMKAVCLGCTGNLEAAEAEFASIEKEDPDFAEVQYWHAYVLANYTDSFKDAIKYAKAAQRMDSGNDHVVHACALFQMMCNYNSGNNAAATADAYTILRLESPSEEDQQDDEDDDLFYFPNLHAAPKCKYNGELYACIAHAVLGDKDLALKEIDHMLAQPYVKPEVLQSNYCNAAIACLILGMETEALDHVKKALEAGARDFGFLNKFPTFKPLRDKTEWKELLHNYQLRFSFELEDLK